MQLKHFKRAVFTVQFSLSSRCGKCFNAGLGFGPEFRRSIRTLTYSCFDQGKNFFASITRSCALRCPANSSKSGSNIIELLFIQTLPFQPFSRLRAQYRKVTWTNSVHVNNFFGKVMGAKAVKLTSSKVATCIRC